MKITIDLSRLPDVTNKVYYPLFENKDRYLVLYGSAGAGKSFFAAEKILYRILTDASKGIKHRFLALRKTQPAVRKSVFALLNRYIDMWGLRSLVDINLSNMVFRFINGSEIICGGLDDPEKLKSIEGVTSAWMEEATEFTENDFTQVDLRIRGKTPSYKQVILTFNPVSRLSWTYKRFFEKKEENATILQTTYKDNRFIDRQYIEILENLKNQDEYTYQVYALGEFGVLRNTIYSNWDIVDEYPSEPDEVIYGEDFGFNNPSVLVELRIKDQEVWIIERIYQTGLTNARLIERMDELKIDKSAPIYADSSEPARIKEIRDAGYNIRESDKSVRDGIDFVKRKKLHIYKDSSNVIKEFQGYKWREDKDGNVLDEPVKFNDHGCDATRYALFTHFQKQELKLWFVGEK